MLRALIYIVSIHLSLYVDTISNEWCSVYRNLSHSLRFVFPFAVFLILCVSPDSMIWLCSLDSAHMHTTPKKQRDEYAQHKKKRKMVEQMRNSEYRYSTATERVMWFYWTVCVCELPYVIVGISAKAKKNTEHRCTRYYIRWRRNDLVAEIFTFHFCSHVQGFCNISEYHKNLPQCIVWGKSCMHKEFVQSPCRMRMRREQQVQQHQQ